jgi:hypothetical protein
MYTKHRFEYGFFFQVLFFCRMACCHGEKRGFYTRVLLVNVEIFCPGSHFSNIRSFYPLGRNSGEARLDVVILKLDFCNSFSRKARDALFFLSLLPLLKGCALFFFFLVQQQPPFPKRDGSADHTVRTSLMTTMVTRYAFRLFSGCWRFFLLASNQREPDCAQIGKWTAHCTILFEGNFAIRVLFFVPFSDSESSP